MASTPAPLSATSAPARAKIKALTRAHAAVREPRGLASSMDYTHAGDDGAVPRDHAQAPLSAGAQR
jgi:hypothetical protein